MRNPLLVLVSLATVAFSALAQTPPKTPKPPPNMALYQFVMLRTGTNTSKPGAEEAAKMQQAHLDGLVELNQKRVNLLFGPFLDKTDLRGIAVLDVPDADAARKAFANDPYVKAGLLSLEVKPWLCETNHFFPPETPQAAEQFVLGFLMRGTNRIQLPAEESQKIQAGHLAYMEELYKQGKLPIAGPFGENSDWRGLVIYRVNTVDEAKELTAGDPAVKAGRLVIDARPWMTFKGILK